MAKASDKAYELLKQRIVGGHYTPGSQLKEEGVASELVLSRTPVRAALKRLVEDGLATADAGRGVRVAAWTESDLKEAYHLRSLLEAYAAQLAAEKVAKAEGGGSGVVEQLNELNRQMARALAEGGEDNRLALQAINSRFHRAILDAAGSPRLRALLEGIIDMPVIVRSFFISTDADIEQSLRHHMDITAAIAAGDGDLARQAMQLHLRIANQRFVRRRAEFVARP